MKQTGGMVAAASFCGEASQQQVLEGLKILKDNLTLKSKV